MTALVGGIVALVLGIIGIAVFWKYFLMLLGGGIPLILILGGALATYLGLEEFKDRAERKKEEESFSAGYSGDEPDKYRAESEKYREEVSALKEEIEQLKSKVVDTDK